MRFYSLFSCVILAAATCAAQTAAATAPTTEVGSRDGAAYRIDVPAEWNHKLVVYYHGYSETPVTYKTDAPNKLENAFLVRGFAVIQSGYSITGWALERAVPETESLRKYFVSQYGQPTETYATGHSMGGALTMLTMEQAPETYTAALPLCGLLGPTDVPTQHAFAMLAAFDYYFPGLLPPLDPVPGNFTESDELTKRVKDALEAHPEQAATMRTLLGLRSNSDVANSTLFGVYIVWDMQHKAGGNPFDNRNYLYTGTPDDRALNDGVKRYAPDGLAAQYITRYYTPTGRVMRPMLAVHTTYDPVINPSSISIYTQEVNRAGFSDNFVQQYVHADGHCNITSEQTGIAFDELLDWVHGGKRPKPGLLP